VYSYSWSLERLAAGLNAPLHLFAVGSGDASATSGHEWRFMGLFNSDATRGWFVASSLNSTDHYSVVHDGVRWQIGLDGRSPLISNTPFQIFDFHMATDQTFLYGGVDATPWAANNGVGEPLGMLQFGRSTWDGSSSASYNIAEVLIYDHILTTEEAQQVRSYLAAKWGLT
jgi:hypothetical protein